MRLLAIESSCDETAAAVVEDGRQVLSSVISSQVEEHRKYGGVVPEIASRRHTENICGVVAAALEQAHTPLAQLDAVAVTAAPGLIGALLVGVNYAKALALAAGKPLVPVHHLRGHIAANYLAHPQLEPPFLCLVVSGGHTHLIEVLSYTDYRLVGRTRDDAAGEAFDKSARSMGFPYPGGVFLDKAAQQGETGHYKLPIPHVAGSELDFSFSGLKTAVINLLHNARQKGQEVQINNLCADFQQTVATILCDKTMLAAQRLGYRTIAAAGGVSANSGLRAMLEQRCQAAGCRLFVPPLSLCGDNAAMIGSQAYYEWKAGFRADSSLNAYATMPIEADFASLLD